MKRLTTLVLFGICMSVGAARSLAQHTPQVMQKCKRATALVMIAVADGEITGSAFCIDSSGLFITNSHVVGKAVEAKGQARLALDIGLKSQRVRPARILRTDDALDLALLKIEDTDLTPLELGQDGTLIETAPVLTYGFPFGRQTTVGDEPFPDISVIPSRITSLKRDKGRLKGVQFNGKLNPGNSGGPVVDASGKVIGVAVATIIGADMNLAIPVGRLADFLKAPGIVFDPPPLDYKSRSMPVNWVIKVKPASPTARLPEKLSVEVKIASDQNPPKIYKAQPVGGGDFKVRVTPVPRDPDRKVELDVRFPNGQAIRLEVKDRDLRVGAARFMLSDLRSLYGGAQPRVMTGRGDMATGRILGLGKIKSQIGSRVRTFDLDEASQINVRPLNPPAPVRVVEAVVEVKQGSEVLASIAKKTELAGSPTTPVEVVRIGRNLLLVPAPVHVPRPVTGGNPSADDTAMVKVGGVLDVSGTPCGAGKSIRPPSVAMGEARLGDAPPSVAKPEVRTLLGHTNEVFDLVLSRDGRFLVTGDGDGVIRVWDPASGATLHTLKRHRGSVNALAMSADGRHVLSGGADHVLRLWEIELGRLLREFPGHGDTIMAIAFTPDGRRCLSAGGERGNKQAGTDLDIWVRDVENGHVLARWPGHTGIIDALAVSPDGKLALSSSADQTARLWDIATGRELRRFPGQTEIDLHAIFSPDGRRAIVTSAGQLVRIFDVETGKELLQLRGHTSKVDSLAASPDGRILVSGSWYERVFRFWDLADGRALGQIGVEGNPQLGTFTPDGKHIFWSFSDRTVREFTVPEPATLTPKPAGSAPGEPLVVSAGGKISDVTLAGGGRFLLLTLKESRELAVFDVNAVAVVKRVSLASADALIAAGARTFVVAYPEQRLIDRWDLETMARRGKRMPSPISARLTGLAMGSDSDGPILAVWSPDSANPVFPAVRFSFLDPGTLKAVKAKSITLGGFQGIGSISTSGGSFVLHPFLQQNTHVRASAGGDLYAMWQTRSSPSGFQTLTVRKGDLRAIYNHDGIGHLAPGPDGLMVYTGSGGPRKADGKPLSGSDPRSPVTNELTFPSSDPAYYLSVCGLGNTGRQNSQAPGITASVHAADGTRLLTVWGLDEMSSVNAQESFTNDDFTVDKRFHLLPAAKLLITVPHLNDRLIVRRLDISRALDETGYDGLIIESPSVLHAVAGKLFEHQIRVRSKGGDVRYTLSDGPEGLTVSPSGKLTWEVPKSPTGDTLKAVISVVEPSGKEHFHTLTILVH